MMPTFVLVLFIYVAFIEKSCSEIYSQSPEVKVTATKGMVIDAGSGGSRLHIFSWQPRIFKTVPPPISFPEANELWTGRMAPGISEYANTPALVSAHLAPLIDFAKVTLGGEEANFGNYPIYFKATGGMRELALAQREEILKYVRQYLSDKTFCPFFFRNDFARVISGEEEAIFSWAATNFLMGTLLPASEGVGSVIGVNKTYGTLDLGGASTQIAFYVPSQDINEGLYNLQIGGQKHWNVYTKSFLQFGIVSARLRHMNELADLYVAAHNLPVVTTKAIASGADSSNSINSNYETRSAHAFAHAHVHTAVPTVTGSKQGSVVPTTVNYCFHAGYSENAVDSTGAYTVDVTGPSQPMKNQLELCMESVKSLMEKKYGKFCNEVYHGDCSIAGAYQPPIPDEQHGHFIGQSSYAYPWNFLMLPQTASLELFKSRAEHVCSLSFGDVLFYFESNNLVNNSNKLNAYLPYYCFLSSYVLVLLQDGYRFKLNQTLTVLSEVNGHSVGWALGAILYEINELPWELQQSPLEAHPIGFMLMASIIGFIVGAVAAVFIYRELVEDKRPANGSRNPGGGPGGPEYDWESLSRVPTMEMMENNRSGTGNGTNGTPPKHKRTNSFTQQNSAPGSPSTINNRKSTTVSAALPSPYSSPQKQSTKSAGIAGMDNIVGGNSNTSSGTGSGVFKNMKIPEFKPFQRGGSGGKYEPIPDT